MSRAFVKNDASDERILVPSRVPLPPGTINYVTPRGMTLLREELAALEAERLEARTNRGAATMMRSGFAVWLPWGAVSLISVAALTVRESLILSDNLATRFVSAPRLRCAPFPAEIGGGFAV